MRELLLRSAIASVLLGGLSISVQAFPLAIAHVNDVHSHLEPTNVDARLDTAFQLRLGGATRVATAFAGLRKEHPDMLFLHAGDEFTGTPWFAHYKGLADAAVLDRLGFDAFVPGNHEFDQGPGVLGAFFDSLHVPVVAANLDASQEPALKGKIRPWLEKNVAGHRVAIVGVAQPETPGISNPGKNLKFSSAASVKGAVDSARKAGAQAVILLSHAGLEVDSVLARTIPGVTAIVGGHSHTRLGGFDAIGLPPSAPYPVVVKTADGISVPVVQSWEWAKEIGVLELEVDSLGRAAAWKGSAFLPASDTLLVSGKPLADSIAAKLRQKMSSNGLVRFVAPDSAMSWLLARLGRPLDSLRGSVVARLPRPLTRRSPDDLPATFARCLLEAGKPWGAQAGLVNGGGVRDDLDSGELSLESIQRVAPFSNTVVVMTLSVAKLRMVLNILDGHHGAPGIAGIVPERDDKGHVRALRLEGATRALDDVDTLRLATISYLAGGGDGCTALKLTSGFRHDTGIKDAEALAAWLSRKFPISRPK